MSTTKPPLSRVCAIALALCCLSFSVAGSQAQPAPEGSNRQQGQMADLRMRAPESLIQSWVSAPRTEQRLILDVILSRRAEALPALRQAAVKGTRVEERLLACSVLGRMRDNGAVSALLAATNDPEEKVRTRALTALRLIGDRSAAPRVRQLVDTETGRPVLKNALVALSVLGTAEDLPRIRRHLANPDINVRVMAAGALARLGSTEAQDVLLAASRDQEGVAQMNATYALGFLDTPESTTRLREILADPRGHWKSEAKIALGLQTARTMSAADRAQFFEKQAQGDDTVVTRWAVEALAEMGTADGVAALRRLSTARGSVARIATNQLKALGLKP